MFELIAGVLGPALRIWEHKEKRKYQDRYLKLVKEWREEYKKPIGVRSDAVLDDLYTQLRDLLAVSPPQLEDRTLRISADFPGFEYDYEVCKGGFLGIGKKCEMKRDRYDLTDPVVRKQLIDMGFVARVREKP